jgi:hypothetical protein
VIFRPATPGAAQCVAATGMRSWSARSFSLASQVMMAKVRTTTSPPGPRQPSHSPASAIGAPSRSATCTERRVTPNANAVTAPHNAPRSSGGVVAAKRVRSTRANSPP